MKPPRLLLPNAIAPAIALTLTLAIALGSAASSAFAETLTRYQATPASKVTVNGTSTIHDWKMEGKIIGGHFEIESNYPLETSAGKLPDLKVKSSAEVSIPVQSIKSGTKRMDEVMLEAMKQPEFPKITYKLTELSPRTGEHKSGDPLEFVSKGELTIAGVTRPVEMTVTVEKFDGNKLKVVGSTPIKMTNHGIKPPAPNIALGLIKVGDEVKVSFEWITARKMDAPK